MAGVHLSWTHSMVKLCCQSNLPTPVFDLCDRCTVRRSMDRSSRSSGRCSTDARTSQIAGPPWARTTDGPGQIGSTGMTEGMAGQMATTAAEVAFHAGLIRASGQSLAMIAGTVTGTAADMTAGMTAGTVEGQPRGMTTGRAADTTTETAPDETPGTLMVSAWGAFVAISLQQPYPGSSHVHGTQVHVHVLLYRLTGLSCGLPCADTPCLTRHVHADRRAGYNDRGPGHTYGAGVDAARTNRQHRIGYRCRITGLGPDVDWR